MNKRYTVISRLTPRGPEYRIYDSLMAHRSKVDLIHRSGPSGVAEMMEEKWNGQNKSDSKEN